MKWQGWRDSNPQPSVLETAVLPIGTTPLKTKSDTGHQTARPTRKL